MLHDADNKGFLYIKRFTIDDSKRHVDFVGDNPDSRLVLITDTPYPRVKVTFGGADAVRAPLEIDVDSFAMVKGIKAKGKRVTTWQVDSVEELEPLRQPEEDSNGNDSVTTMTVPGSRRKTSTQTPERVSSRSLTR